MYFEISKFFQNFADLQNTKIKEKILKMSHRELDRAYDDFRLFCEEYRMDALSVERTNTYFEAEVSIFRLPEELDSKSAVAETVLNNIKSSYSLKGTAVFDQHAKTWKFRFEI